MADKPSPFSVWSSMIPQDAAGIWKIFNHLKTGLLWNSSSYPHFAVWRTWGSVAYMWVCEVKVAQSCPTLCNPIDSTVHGILQARILERVAFSCSRRSSQSRDGTQVSHIAGRFFTSWATREAHSSHDGLHTVEASCHVAPYCFYFSSSWILYTIQLFLVYHGFSLCPSCFASPGLSRTANCHSWHTEMNFWVVEKSVPGFPGGLW